MNAARVALAATLIVASACDDPLYPSFRLPEPSVSLDPDSLRAPVMRYLNECGWLNGPAPTENTVILDAYFPRRRESDPTDRPHDDYLKGVATAGGAVGYVFNFPAARIRIAPARVPELAETGVALYSPPDLRRYDWLVFTRFSREISAGDSTAFSALGGRVVSILRLGTFFSLRGYLPDRSIPALRAMPGVQEVMADNHFCNSA